MSSNDPLIAAETESQSRFRRNSGTYYIDGTRSCHWKRWCCALVLLLLLLLTIAGAFALSLYLLPPSECEKAWMQVETSECIPSFLSQEWHNDYKRFVMRYCKTNVTDICNRAECFRSSLNLTVDYEPFSLAGDYLGVTIFSDWCQKERDSYRSKTVYANPIQISLESVNVDSFFAFSDDIAGQVVFNDSVGLNEEVKSALLQWHFYSKTRIAEKYQDVDAFLANSSNFPLYGPQYSAVTLESMEARKIYLNLHGPFATEIDVNEAIFFLREKFLRAEFCDKPIHIKKLLVIVYGYGAEMNYEGTEDQYWLVQPIGEVWKKTEELATLKISAACFMNANWLGVSIPNGNGMSAKISYI